MLIPLAIYVTGSPRRNYFASDKSKTVHAVQDNGMSLTKVAYAYTGYFDVIPRLHD